MSKISIKSLNPIWRWFRGERDSLIIELTPVALDIVLILKGLAEAEKAKLLQELKDWIYAKINELRNKI